jgi:predicted Ser/Thr protein kinase
MKAGAGSTPAPSTGGAAVDFPDIGDPADVARRLPQFEILELLGRGGMGVVYKAVQRQIDRTVALKILPPVDALSPDFVERFRREARSLAKLNHPNIVTLHEFGETGGLYYFVMEFVDGVNLREMIRTGEIKAGEALALVPKICDALQFAHEEGVVHRDIKPENILVDKRGRLKIADFGLAKILRREQVDHTLTATGMTLGTPRYMAPEQLDRPETVDHRADIYSLGVVFYEMLTGEVPMGRFAPPSEKVRIDVRLDEIVLHAMERDVDRRYQHASEVRQDVEHVTSKPVVTGPVVSGAPATPPQPAAAKPWAVWLWSGLLILSVLPFLQITELNRHEALAGKGPKFGLGEVPRLMFLALGGFSVIRLLELRRVKKGTAAEAAFSQAGLAVIAACFGICLLSIGSFPYVEWLHQTLEVFPQKVTNAVGATVELEKFSQTYVQHGYEFVQGRIIAGICVLAGAFILLAPRRRLWNVARSVLLIGAGTAIIWEAGSFDLPRDFAGSTQQLPDQAKADPKYRAFLDDFWQAEDRDANQKNVPQEHLAHDVPEKLDKPHTTPEQINLLERLYKSSRPFWCKYKPGDGLWVCYWAALGLILMGVLTLRQTFQAAPAAFSGFFSVVETWSGLLLLTPCLLTALLSAWVENVAWIPPGRENPVILKLLDYRVRPVGAEFWQGRVIAAVCALAILVLAAAAFKWVKPGLRALALSLAGILSITAAVSFGFERDGFKEVPWQDFLAVAQYGAAAAESAEIREYLARRPQFVAQLAHLKKDLDDYRATLAPDSPEARKIDHGPSVSIYQNSLSGSQFSFLCGVGLLLLGLRDGWRAWKNRHKPANRGETP